MDIARKYVTPVKYQYKIYNKKCYPNVSAKRKMTRVLAEILQHFNTWIDMNIYIWVQSTFVKPEQSCRQSLII